MNGVLDARQKLIPHYEIPKKKYLNVMQLYRYWSKIEDSPEEVAKHAQIFVATE